MNTGAPPSMMSIRLVVRRAGTRPRPNPRRQGVAQPSPPPRSTRTCSSPVGEAHALAPPASKSAEVEAPGEDGVALERRGEGALEGARVQGLAVVWPPAIFMKCLALATRSEGGAGRPADEETDVVSVLADAYRGEDVLGRGRAVHETTRGIEPIATPRAARTLLALVRESAPAAGGEDGGRRGDADRARNAGALCENRRKSALEPPRAEVIRAPRTRARMGRLNSGSSASARAKSA